MLITPNHSFATNKVTMNKSNPHFPVNILINDSTDILNILCEEYERANSFNIGLDSRILISASDSYINDIAELKPCIDEENREYHQIHIWDNYCQFLWVLCYSSIVLIDELIINPKLSKSYVCNKLRLDQAMSMFNVALKLYSKDDKDRPTRGVFFEYPNPFNKTNKYTGSANVLFTTSLAFILFHEYSHFYLNHYETKNHIGNFIKDELDADYYAIYTMCTSQNPDIQSYTSVSAVIALQSTIFIDGTLKGDSSHPDPIIRLQRLLDNLCDLPAKDKEYCYLMAISIYKMWALNFGCIEIISNVTTDGSYSEYLQNIHEALSKIYN